MALMFAPFGIVALKSSNYPGDVFERYGTLRLQKSPSGRGRHDVVSKFKHFGGAIRCDPSDSGDALGCPALTGDNNTFADDHRNTKTHEHFLPEVAPAITRGDMSSGPPVPGKLEWREDRPLPEAVVLHAD